MEVDGKVKLASKSASEEATLKLPSRDVAIVKLKPQATGASSAAVGLNNPSVVGTPVCSWVEASTTKEVLPPQVADV